MTENKYSVPLGDLERTAHVPRDEQVEEHDTEPPPPDAVSETTVERNRLTRIAGF